MRILLLVGLICSTSTARAVSYHTVGWVNTFVPGGGAALRGEFWTAGLQFGLEVTTFSIGYSLSAKSPLTLDGVPENIPNPHSGEFTVAGKKSCVRYNARGQCSRYKVTNGGAVQGDTSVKDITRSLQADILQEVGIKSHMVNVFDSYRIAAGSADVGQGIDQTSVRDLFLEPFRGENLSDVYVYVPLMVSLAFHAYSYSTEPRVTSSPLNASSNTQFGFVYGVVYPTGSAAPEEMFYRGFLQNEFYQWTGTPYAAIPLSTACYTLSHSPDSWLSAGASGLYLGSLAYLSHGRLRRNIAFHFWSDVIMGIHAILTLNRNEHTPPGAGDAPVSLVNYAFEF